MIVYLYRKCSTCQQAIRFLEQRGVNIEIKEIDKEPPSIEDLRKMLKFQKGNIKKLLNTSGLLYRELGLANKVGEMKEEDLFSLLNKHGMLVKRPFLLGDDFGLVGFKEVEWSHALG